MFWCTSTKSFSDYFGSDEAYYNGSGHEHRRRGLYECDKVRSLIVEQSGMLQRSKRRTCWDTEQTQKMLKASDLNFDRKIDFNEFELIMG